MKLISLSYNLSKNTQSYGGRHKIKIAQYERIQDGSTANSFMVEFYNHIGTHIDCPNHFYSDGLKICDYDINYFIFNEPQIIDVDLSSKNEIDIDNLSEPCIHSSDIIFFRTYFSKKRKSEDYIKNYPVFKLQLVNHLKKNCKNLRAIGFDIISLTSPLNKNEGKEAHKILLGNDNPILIVEDMKLDFYDDKISKIIISPYFFEEIDSAPCSVYGIIE